MKRLIILCAALAAQFSTNLAIADGSETLGEPSITIANGTDIITAGTGLLYGPGDIEIEIPQGATVQQVLLYWNGFANYRSEADDTVKVNDNEVTGTLLSGNDGDWFYYLLKSWSFRADITDLGVVGPGANTLTISDASFKLATNGAGILVIVDDGSGPRPLVVRDGDDLAYVEFESPRDTTVPQEFTFDPATTDRMATIDMFFAAVEGDFSTLGELRPTVIEVTVGSEVFEFNNLLGSIDQFEWDTLEITVPVPAGVTALTVQALSEDRLNTGEAEASFAWLAAGLTIPPADQPLLGSLGDFVWEDLDRNGIQDNGELGIEGVQVLLTDCADPANILRMTSTDSDGLYRFDNLESGAYCVQFMKVTGELPCSNGGVFSPNNGGIDVATNSDADPDTGITAVINLGTGESNLNVDAGLYCPPLTDLGSLGDFVWEDLDADGIQDNDEPGIQGVQVELYHPDPTTGGCSDSGQYVETAFTDDQGKYLFDDLEEGSYCVKFIKEPSLLCNAEIGGSVAFSPNNGVVNVTYNSDADEDSGFTSVIALGAAENNPKVDAGLYCPAKLGDFVWDDTNRDGDQDAGEIGIIGVDVVLLRCNADGSTTQIDTTSTDADGLYMFNPLMPGDYAVQFTAPDGYVFSPANAGGNTVDSDKVDSDAYTASGITACVPLHSNQVDPTRDAGLHQPPAGLGDRLWDDKNADGVQNPGEPGIPGAMVNLLTPGTDGSCGTGDEDFVDDMTTGNDGYYFFDGLVPDNYCVEFEKPLGYCVLGEAEFTLQNVGHDTEDSDVNRTTGQTGVIALASNESDPTNDAGIYCPAELGDTVWKDVDLDGIQDLGEPGVDAVEVQLYKCDANGDIVGGSIDTTSTLGGIYRFSNLVPGSYAVRFIEPVDFDFTLLNVDNIDGDAGDSDADSGGFTACVELESNEYDSTVDAGLIEPQGCGLDLVKTCEVVAPPPPPLESCDGKIQSFTLIWNGLGNITVSGIDNDAGGEIVPGQEVTFSAPIDGWDNNDNFLTISGDVTGESVFHVSCSDDSMDGETDDAGFPSDCYRPNGDGKDDEAGFISDWLFEGLTDASNQVVDCTAPVIEPTSSCAFPATVASCDTLPDKPTMFSFQYTGGGCDAADNSQGSKFECGGSISVDSTVTLMTSAGETHGNVKPGDLVTIEKDGSETTVTLDDGSGGIETIVFHTSCSVPLISGEVFGSLTLAALDGQGSGKEVLYSYAVSNTGASSISNIAVTDDKLGDVGNVDSLNGGQSITLFKSGFISEDTINVGTASAGGACVATAEATVTVLPPPPCTVTSSFKELKDDLIKYTVTNTGNRAVTLDELTFDFPTAYVAIRELKLDGAIYKSGDSSLVVGPGVTIGSGDWTQADVSKRVLDPGESRTLEIKFEKKAKNFSQADFSGPVNFNDGECTTLL